MSSDTQSDAPDSPRLPTPDRSWQAPAGSSVFEAAGVADDSPPLPTLPPAVPVTPAVTMPLAVGPATSAFGYRDVPGGMAAVHRASVNGRARRQSPLLHRIVRTVIVLTVVAGVGAVGFVLVQGVRDARSLPTFPTERPAYGTVVMTYEERTGDDVERATITAGADPALFHLVLDPSSAEEAAIVSDGTTMYMEQPDGSWIASDLDAELAAAMSTAAVVPVFDDYVPTAMRPFVEVADKADRDLRERAVQRLELFVDHVGFESSDPEAAAEWKAFVGWEGAEVDDGATGTRLVLWVDAVGIVWLIESWSDLSEGRNSYELMSFDSAQFVPPVPMSYFDDRLQMPVVDGRVQYDCESDRRTLEVAVEAFGLDAGRVPASEADLIPAYLVGDVMGYDVVDGVTVPVPGRCG